MLLIVLLLAAVGLAGAVAAHRAMAGRDVSKEDIYYAWLEGYRINHGVNPYAFILESDMRENRGYYATYLPGFYLLSALTQRLGLETFDRWLSIWRFVFLLFNFGIAGLLFVALAERDRPVLGLFAVGLWLFNRWTLRVVAIAHLDFLPIFFLLVSLLVLEDRLYVSCVLFGVSLALKQVAVFVGPLYLIRAWQASPSRRVVRTALAALAVAAVPIATSVPFLIWHAEGFVRSVLFSVTRTAADHFHAPSLDAMLTDHGVPLTGPAARLPLLVLLALVYVAAARRRLGTFTGTVLVLATFLYFNPVLFRQYMCWVVPFLPLVVLDVGRWKGDPRCGG